jgi:hypothetical protein
MNWNEIAILAAALVVSMIVTIVFFFVLRFLRVQSRWVKAGSSFAFPGLLILIIAYVEIWDPDPHGFVMVGLGFLALLSLPATVLTAALLARRFN